MHILSLQPYYGGSHKYVMDALQAASRHTWHLLSLPPRQWQWRMRHAALTFAEDLAARELNDEIRKSEVIFCSDMLNLAEFRGLAPGWTADLPAVVYFHENQFAYPARKEYQQKQNAHFGFINMRTGCAATEVWFNSAHNRDSFFAGLERYLKKQRDEQPWESSRRLRAKSRIIYPGIHIPSTAATLRERQPGPLRIAWAARWEYDKGPRRFFDALGKLKAQKIPFRLRVLGEQFQRRPPVFERAAKKFHAEIDAWGYEPSRQRYLDWLKSSDVIVSSAKHEFFGISILEGAACGAAPILPNSLSYPEIFAGCNEIFYDGTAEDLARILKKTARLVTPEIQPEWRALRHRLHKIATSYDWRVRIQEFDKRLASAGK